MLLGSEMENFIGEGRVRANLQSGNGERTTLEPASRQLNLRRPVAKKKGSRPTHGLPAYVCPPKPDK